MSDIDGNNRVTVMASVAHVFSISIFEGDIFWSEWNSSVIEGASWYVTRCILRKRL